MNNYLTSEEAATLSRLLSTGTAQAIRERAGYTETDFASRIGVTGRTLRSWENNRTTPRTYAARKYLKELRHASDAIVQNYRARRSGHR